MNPQRQFLGWAFAALLAASLSACGGGSASVPLNGSLNGLTSGASVTLSDGLMSMALSGNGNFQFSDPNMTAGSAYNVTVTAQPAGELCSVSNGAGAVDPNADPVSGITVNCVPAATVGGTVAGLASGTSVSVTDGTSTLNIAANGSFTLPDAFAAGGNYNLSIAAQPAGQACSLVNASGTIDSFGTPVTSVGVLCSANGTVGGMVSGLPAGSTITLSDGATTLTVQANGMFGFTDTYVPGAAYQVSVLNAPAGQSCSVSNGSGQVDALGDAVNNVMVSCLPNGTLNGVVTGLAPGAIVTLTDGTTTLTLGSNGSFAFNDVAPAGVSYAVSITGQPSTGSCSVSGNVSGNFDANDDPVSGVVVTCSGS